MLVHDWPNRITAISTLLLVIFACFAWREAIKASRIAHDQLVAGDAAFVFLEDTSFVQNSTKPPSWFFVPRLRNSGNTPALDLNVLINYVPSGPLMPGGYLANAPITTVPVILGPKSSNATRWFELKPEHFVAHRLTIWGYAKYSDSIEKKRHITRFCQVLEGWSGDPKIPIAEAKTPFIPVFSLCAEGNCRDEECYAQDAKYVKNQQ